MTKTFNYLSVFYIISFIINNIFPDTFFYNIYVISSLFIFWYLFTCLKFILFTNPISMIFFFRDHTHKEAKEDVRKVVKNFPKIEYWLRQSHQLCINKELYFAFTTLYVVSIFNTSNLFAFYTGIFIFPFIYFMTKSGTFFLSEFSNSYIQFLKVLEIESIKKVEIVQIILDAKEKKDFSILDKLIDYDLELVEEVKDFLLYKKKNKK